MTSRELVIRTLEFENRNGRAPRELWTLPWAHAHYSDELAQIVRNFPGDFGGPAVHTPPSPISKGDPYAIGTYVDDWGCVFENLQAGVIGEVKNPIVPAEDEDWDDVSAVHIPYEALMFDTDEVNASCRATDKFVKAAFCPRPFEQLQFIRGTEQLYMDLAMGNEGLDRFIQKMHAFYCEGMEKWAKTEVDALMFMDDWGAQNNLLISPDTWRRVFRPLYKDYIDIAHSHGKKIFMHSDGNILKIYPELIDMGLDAVNSQLFCMGLEELSQFRGKICFWGEMDRQHLLPNGTPQQIADAVVQIKELLWQDGGCIAQCEFGPGGRPENVRAMYETWDRITGK